MAFFGGSLEIKMGFPKKIRPKLKMYTHFVQDKDLSYHFHKKYLSSLNTVKEDRFFGISEIRENPGN